ncbi:MAG: hypothetical protein EXR67_01780 [Dehalococcoidia bacterium]|nr:hypothetical protein [Dehalococcoidia bacterium]
MTTVRGPIKGEDLGFTLSHEHVIASSAGVTQLYPEFLGLPQRKYEAVDLMSFAYREGVRAIIDCIPIDLGRDIPLLEEVSRKSQVPIIAATGVWTQIPHAFWQATPDQLANLFIREIRVGMQGSSVKAGVIKVASDFVPLLRAPSFLSILMRHVDKSRRFPRNILTPARVPFGRTPTGVKKLNALCSAPYAGCLVGFCAACQRFQTSWS